MTETEKGTAESLLQQNVAEEGEFLFGETAVEKIAFDARPPLRRPLHAPARAMTPAFTTEVLAIETSPRNNDLSNHVLYM